MNERVYARKVKATCCSRIMLLFESISVKKKRMRWVMNYIAESMETNDQSNVPKHCSCACYRTLLYYSDKVSKLARYELGNGNSMKIDKDVVGRRYGCISLCSKSIHFRQIGKS